MKTKKEIHVLPNGDFHYFELLNGQEVEVQSRDLSTGDVITATKREATKDEVNLIKTKGAHKLKVKNGKLIELPDAPKATK